MSGTVANCITNHAHSLTAPFLRHVCDTHINLFSVGTGFSYTGLDL